MSAADAANDDRWTNPMACWGIVVAAWLVLGAACLAVHLLSLPSPLS